MKPLYYYLINRSKTSTIDRKYAKNLFNYLILYETLRDFNLANFSTLHGNDLRLLNDVSNLKHFTAPNSFEYVEIFILLNNGSRKVNLDYLANSSLSLI